MHGAKNYEFNSNTIGSAKYSLDSMDITYIQQRWRVYEMYNKRQDLLNESYLCVCVFIC